MSKYPDNYIKSSATLTSIAPIKTEVYKFIQQSKICCIVIPFMLVYMWENGTYIE